MVLDEMVLAVSERRHEVGASRLPERLRYPEECRQFLKDAIPPDRRRQPQESALKILSETQRTGVLYIRQSKSTEQDLGFSLRLDLRSSGGVVDRYETGPYGSARYIGRIEPGERTEPSGGGQD